MAVCLSIRCDLEKHPRQWPICDGFSLDSPWGCSQLSVTVPEGSATSQVLWLPNIVFLHLCFMWMS